MEIRFYIKINEKYELRELIPEKECGRTFFENIILNIDEQLEFIKNDIIEYIGNDDNITFPKHDDYVIQKKLDKLSSLRKQNLYARQQMKNALQENDFIICKCGSKMYKYPIGIPFRKVGTGYLLLEEPDNIKYLYRCEKCWRCTDPIFIEEEKRNLKIRNSLIREGYNYVPDKLGIWNYINDGKPLSKPPYLQNKPERTWRRTFERSEDDNLVLVDTCVETGEVKKIELV